MHNALPCPRVLLLSWALLVPSGPLLAQHASRKGTHSSEPGQFAAAPRTLDFGAVEAGETRSLALTLSNRAFAPLELRSIGLLLGTSGNSSAFEVELGRRTYAGSTVDTVHTLYPPLVIAGGLELVATVTFEPLQDQLDAIVLRFSGSDTTVDVPISGLGSHSGHLYLHVVIDGPRVLVDYDRDGSETLFLDGTASHTHESGHSIAAFEWRVGGEVLANTATLSTLLTAPATDIGLTIFDDSVPPRILAEHVEARVVAPDQVPGVLTSYYEAGESGAAALLDAVPASADFVEPRPTMSLGGAVQIGGSPFIGDVLVRMEGRLSVEDPVLLGFTTSGSAGQRLFVDGMEISLPVFLDSGQHSIEARFAVDTLADLPLEVSMLSDGEIVPISDEIVTHDQTGVVPLIHTMTSSGSPSGGDPITIDGFGFFAAQDVVVHWGELDLVAADLTLLTPTRIEFLSPTGGAGTIDVSVENASGTSETNTYLYELVDLPPIQFRRDLILELPSPTAGAWAPDGKLYVASLDGRITALEFDEDYELVSQTPYPGVSGLSNNETLALAVNPYDPPDPVRLYVAHGDHFLHGGHSPTGPSPYTGQVSVLTGPDFSTPEALVTGLPVSNNSHAVNALAFDDNGDLLISVGSMTNAGIQDPNLGDLPESPLSAAVLKARLSKPSFNGAVTYVETQTGLPNDDQRLGESVDVAPGVDVEVHAAGLRNAFGLVYTTKGRLYLTDNGPNVGYGPASNGPKTQAPDPSDEDELNLIEWNNYYGMPNRSRGRTDPRQNDYYGGLSGPPSIPDTLFQMVAWLPSSSDGLDEYRANTFQGRMRGDLIVQKYLGKLRRVRLTPDGRALVEQSTLEPITRGLGCITGPGGAIVALDYQYSEVEILEPRDATSPEFAVHDIFPWRAPAAGGAPFVIAGRGFGTLETTKVWIGGWPTVLTEVTGGRIRGIVPAAPNATTSLLDVLVTVGEGQNTLPSAFRYLLGAGNEPGRWETLADVSADIGSVAAGVIGGEMILVGQGARGTFVYDLQARRWLDNGATRPYLGRYHAAEVVDGKLYLIGGLGGGSEGRVQIYDRTANTWTAGASLPWRGGAVGTAVIGGKIYAAGGLTTGSTSSDCAQYDPGTDVWTTLSAMPHGRSHAASGTDGTDLFVFGGRRGLDLVANGYDSVMIYDPEEDSWTWSGDSGSTLAPLPEARSGMGKAVYLRGEFYLFGGEALDDPDANIDGVYDRVDVYDPLANAWRDEARMPNPRHGIYPVLYQGHVFLAGGGMLSGASRSTLFDTFTRQ